MAKKSKGPKKQPTGDYPIGYCRPPLHTRTHPGQVLNPHGRNGKSIIEPDAFEKARQRRSRVTIDGETVMVPSDEAYWLSQMARALAGDKTAAKIVAQEWGARRRLAPPPPTPEDLAQREAEQTEREALSARLVRLLNEEASRKKNGSSQE